MALRAYGKPSAGSEIRYHPQMDPANTSKNFWRLPISGGVPWTSIVLSVLMATVAIGMVFSARMFVSATQLVAHTETVRVEIEALLVSLNEAESAHRGFLLGGEQELRRQGFLAQAKTKEIATKLPTLVSDNPDQKSRAHTLQRLLIERFELIEKADNAYARDGEEKARAFWVKLRGTSMAPTAARALGMQLLEEENKLLVERQSSAKMWALAMEASAIAGMSLALMLVVFSGRSYRRERRIQERSAVATQKANDELEDSVDKLQKERQSAQALADFAGLLQGCQTQEEIFDVAGHALPMILPGTSGTIYLMRASRDHAHAQADWGNFWKERPESISPNQCWGLRQGRPFHADKGSLTCAHRATLDNGPSTCVPMVVQGNEVGLLFIQHPAGWSSTSMAEAASEQLALAITNLNLRETLRTQSLRDALTGLSNRRELEEQLPKEIARSQRAGGHTSVLLLDIDHFKRFNDTHGHDAGDAVLREFGHALQKMARQEDIVARLGGEEFVIVLSNANVEAAKEFAERVCASVTAMDVKFRDTSLGKVTASIGVAECPTHAVDANRLLSLADEALYRAKNNGRNRVEISTSGSHPPA